MDRVEAIKNGSYNNNSAYMRAVRYVTCIVAQSDNALHNFIDNDTPK